jgi:arylsulfatase A-like enzyme
VLYIVLDDVGYSAMAPYGGLIETPNIDRIAQRGLTYTNFHTTALCSPTRSCLMTGRNHTTNGMATITEAASGFPSSNGHIPFECATIAEVLGEHGWNTYMSGKWHLTAEDEMNMASRKAQWPVGRGFERFYGFLGAETNQWYPDLVYDNHPVEQPRSPEEGYHLTEDLTDKALEFIRDAKAVAPDKPFFLYYCPGACHAPHHAPKEWIDKYRGKFDMGYEAYRDLVFERQKRMGVVTGNAELSPVNPYINDTSADGKGWPELDTVRPWDSLSDDEKRLFARMAEVYAGFLSHADHQIGRLLDFLEESGQLDNTIIVLVSDNGASGEGGPNGSVNENKMFNGIADTIEANMPQLEERPQLTKPWNRYVYYPGTAEVPRVGRAEHPQPLLHDRGGGYPRHRGRLRGAVRPRRPVRRARALRQGPHAQVLLQLRRRPGADRRVGRAAAGRPRGPVGLLRARGRLDAGRGHPHPAHGRPGGGAGPDQDPARQVLHRRRGAQHRQGRRRAGLRGLPGPGAVGLHRRHDPSRGGRRQRRAVRRPGRRSTHGLYARLNTGMRD